MALNEVIAQIDAEIAKLQQARALLSGGEKPAAKRGRPKGSKNASATAAKTAPVAKNSSGRPKRELSPQGRKAIVDAMNRRWAANRKETR